MATGRRNTEWLAGRWPQKQRRQWRLAAATQSGLLVRWLINMDEHDVLWMYRGVVDLGARGR